MNLSSQLAALAARPKEEASVAAPHPRLKNLLLGGPSQSDKAIERYKAVMEPRGWMKQSEIECALGYAATVSTCFLKKLLEKKLVQRRNKDGAKKFSKRLGYEWKWNKEESSL